MLKVTAEAPKVTARHCNLYSQSSCTRAVMELGEQDDVAVAAIKTSSQVFNRNQIMISTPNINYRQVDGC